MSTESKQSILYEAEKIIYGDRERTYGDPGANLKRIAALWSAYLSEGDQTVMLLPDDVAQMMILLKLARLVNTPRHRDSLVDICGYAALIERLKETQD